MKHKNLTARALALMTLGALTNGVRADTDTPDPPKTNTDGIEFELPFEASHVLALTSGQGAVRIEAFGADESLQGFATGAAPALVEVAPSPGASHLRIALADGAVLEGLWVLSDTAATVIGGSDDRSRHHLGPPIDGFAAKAPPPEAGLDTADATDSSTSVDSAQEGDVNPAAAEDASALALPAQGDVKPAAAGGASAPVPSAQGDVKPAEGTDASIPVEPAEEADVSPAAAGDSSALALPTQGDVKPAAAGDASAPVPSAQGDVKPADGTDASIPVERAQEGDVSPAPVADASRKLDPPPPTNPPEGSKEASRRSQPQG
jgi:hypothetical protein